MNIITLTGVTGDGRTKELQLDLDQVVGRTAVTAAAARLGVVDVLLVGAARGHTLGVKQPVAVPQAGGWARFTACGASDPARRWVELDPAVVLAVIPVDEVEAEYPGPASLLLLAWDGTYTVEGEVAEAARRLGWSGLI